jgi:hypothetical protein
MRKPPSSRGSTAGREAAVGVDTVGLVQVSRFVH